MISKLIERLAAQWQSENPAEIMLVSAGATACLMPVVGLVPTTFAKLLIAYDYDPRMAAYLSVALWGAAAPVMFAKLAKEHRQIKRLFFSNTRKRGLMLGSMWVPEKVLLTHLKVTGMTGSGKSATVFIPALKQLLNTYCDEDNDRRSKNEFKKIGMAVLEVKGTFFEYIVYLVHEAGRNSSVDVVLFRPDSRLPLAHFVDKVDSSGRPAKDARHWYLNAMPHTWAANETSSEAHRLFERLNRPGNPSEIYPPTVFREDKTNRELQAELASIDVPVGPDTRFVGWRREGEHLVRVSHTPIRDCPEKLLKNGREVRVLAPKTLRFVDMLYVSNGLKTNIIKPNLPVSEIASRLAILTKMADGGDDEKKGGNDFFFKAARKQMQYCISLHRAVHHADGAQCTPIELVRLTTDEEELKKYLTQVASRVRVLKAEIERVPDVHSRQLRLDREVSPLVDLISYFNNEWSKFQQGEGKVANSVNGVITNAFSQFLADPNLRETYCSPQTIDYRTIFNDGAIICFVPGKEYETSAKLLAVDFKMDVVSTALARKNLGLEMHRLAMFVQDEGHEYIFSHDTVGDNKALAQLREFRFFYLMGTQSDAWVDVAIGRTPAKVYLQGYGTNVYLRNNDEATNDRAAMLAGKIKVEDRSVKQNMSLGGLLTGDDVSTSQTLGYKEKNFVEAHEFNHLRTGAGVVVRTGEDGQEHQVKCVNFQYDFATSDEGHAAVGDRLRWYFCEVVENTLHKVGQSDRIDHNLAPRPADPPAAGGNQPTSPAGVPPRGPAPEAESGPELQGQPQAVLFPQKPLSPTNPLPLGGREAILDLPNAPTVPEEASAPPKEDIPQPRAPEKKKRSPDFVRVRPPEPELTARAIADQVEKYDKHLIRLSASLDAIGFQPMINYSLYQAEMAERIAAANRPAHELANVLAHGPGGKILGNREIGSKADPKLPVPRTLDLSDIQTDADTAAREAAVREARDGFEGTELRPAQGIDQETLLRNAVGNIREVGRFI
jgi:hypothetical protein